jgi:Glycosyl hydrolase family 10
MGQLRFLVPELDSISRAVQSAYISGQDDLPWVTHASLRGKELLVERDTSESGKFQILWPVADRGLLLLSTATLLERPELYNLPVELARGTLNRLRNQIATCEMSGITLPTDVNAAAEKSLQSLGEAATSDVENETNAMAQQSIEAALAGINSLSTAQTEHAMELLQRQPARSLPLVGGRFGADLPHGAARHAFTAAFNAAMVPFTWSRVEADEGRQRWSIFDEQVQWCQKHGLRICGGPLLELDQKSLPDWLFLWEGDFDNLLSVAGDHLRAVVNRYRGKVNFWNVASRLIRGEVLGLDEEHKLRLVGQAIEIVRSLDPETPVIATFDQPCGEYLAQRESDLSPLHFADALVRSELGLAGIGLELDVGLEQGATLPRDTLEFSRQIERWAVLGLPLVVSVSAASAGDGFSLQSQQAWIENHAPLFLCRPIVQGLFWNQLFDSESQDAKHAGLVDNHGQIKPAFRALPALRKKYSA